ncbi:MAG: sel1 repeat family protein [Clostridiales bacterium]|nr:sel1 repeat family protein [Clostridiales bacterium]
MARLILKSPYIKGGARAVNYAKYIGTRERVELVHDGRPATKKQEQLIASLVKDFPDAKKLPEYSRYHNSPTKVHASVFITQALEDNWDGVQQSDIYAKYIATRPQVERLGSHGLFGDEDYVDLKKVTAELEHCEKNVWTHIVSLKREDAVRLGYDNARAWRNLLRAHRNDIAAAMNIPPNDFRWYAAFHDEGDHPHIHMMAWSAGDALGYLSPVGIREIKSALTNDIFRQEMLHVYEQKSTSRDELVAEARRTMLELADEMKRGVCEHPEAEQLMLTLSSELKNVKGKKQYGYLPQRVKKQVDEIVDQMARLPSVQTCYQKWLELQQEVNEFYSDKPMERTPLSQQKEFRVVHNAVVQAAVQLGQLTFEDKDIAKSDESDDVLQASNVYWNLWTVICDEREPLDLRDKGVAHLRSRAEGGNPYAQLMLGRLYRDGPLLTPDWVEARYWFEQAAQSLPDAQYALGKLLLTDDVEVHDREQGIHWLTQAAEHGNDCASYRLGKELLRSGDPAKALSWLTASAEADNPYAKYLLGKLCWEGEIVPQDKEQAVFWLGQAAAQGHTQAQILLERQDSSSLPSAILAVNNLLHQMGRIFQDNAWPQDGTRGQHTERKLRKKMQQKRIAMGHKPDDHEEQTYTGPAM